MNKTRMFRVTTAAAVLATIALAAIAFGAATIQLIAGGKQHSVRAVLVGGSWYVSAADVARALGNGASFDATKEILYASASDKDSQMHTVDRTAGGFATDGSVAARLVSVKNSMSFQGNAPDPGAHFVMAVLELKNISSVPVPMFQVQSSMVAGSQHLNDGQFYDQNGNDLPDTQVSPGQTVTYLDVFELNDGVTADAILLHPPFAPATRPIDILLKL